MSLSRISNKGKIKSMLAITICVFLLIFSTIIVAASLYLLTENKLSAQGLLSEIGIELPRVDIDASNPFENKTLRAWITSIITLANINLITTTTPPVQSLTTLQTSTTTLAVMPPTTTTLIEQDLTNQTTTTMSPTTTTIGQYISTSTTTLTSSTSTSTTIQSTTSTTPTSTTTLASSTSTSTTTVTTSLKTIQMMLVYPPHGHTTTGKNITFSYTPHSANTLSNCSIYLTLNGSWGIGGIDTTIFNNKSNTFSFFNMGTGTYYWNIGCSTISGERELGMFNNTFILF